MASTPLTDSLWYQLQVIMRSKGCKSSANNINVYPQFNAIDHWGDESDFWRSGLSWRIRFFAAMRRVGFRGLFCIIGVLSLTACVHGPVAQTCEIKLDVDSEISDRTPEFCAVSRAAIRNVSNFAAQNGLGVYLSRPIISRVEILKSRERLEGRLREIYKAPPETVFPSGLSAGNDAQDVLLLIPEEEAQKFSPKFIEPGFYEKLATHELIHLLHVRVVDGNEDEMGPVWFFEGLPAMASRQLEGFGWPDFPREYVAVIKDPKRGDYRKYAYIVRNLAKQIPIKDLIARARKPNFNSWAIEALRAK